MTDSLTISNAPPAQPALDVEALRRLGMAYIETHASHLWTDYNRHDPGMTTLDLACYALTDVSLRANLPMRDLLTSALGGPTKVQHDFAKLTAGTILPTSPVSELDYRKLFIDLPGVQNAYLLKANRSIFADLDQADAQKRLSYTAEPPPARRIEIKLNGLYDIHIAFDQAYIQQQPAVRAAHGKTPAELAAAQKVIQNQLLKDVRREYMSHRNLGEDVDAIIEVPTHGIMFCADLDLAPGAVVKEVYARVLLVVEQYLNPPVKRYSLAEMQAKTDANGQRLTIDQIFDGPPLLHGFIPDDELAAADLRHTVYTSDLINLVLAIEIDGKKAVRAMRKVLLNHCQTPDLTGQRWCLHVPPGQQPRLCRDKVALAFFKDIVPVGSQKDKDAALHLLDRLQAEAAGVAERQTVDLPVPTGVFQSLTPYRSIANDFPQTYGIGPLGLPANATELRRAQASQFKGYLLFFDQLLANYLRQLHELGTLLSTQRINAGIDAPEFARTYFGQPVTDMAGVENLWKNPLTVDNELQKALDEPNGKPHDTDRRSRLLDHLLGRFAEDFGEYAVLMRTVFGQKSETDLLADKARFLRDYETFTIPKAYDYSQPAWDKDNLAGVVRRIARLAGMDNPQAHTASAIADTPDKPDHGAEVIFLIEHMLLRPRPAAVAPAIPDPAAAPAPNDPDTANPHWLSLCLNLDGTHDEPLDPYSYRLSIVLPGYTERLKNVPFRRFLEKVIRLELPAHLLARICWVGNDDLKLLETDYKAWLEARADLETALANETLPRLALENALTNESIARKTLIDRFERLHTVYTAGVLHNCDNENEVNPMILGRSALGSLPSA